MHTLLNLLKMASHSRQEDAYEWKVTNDCSRSFLQLANFSTEKFPKNFFEFVTAYPW